MPYLVLDYNTQGFLVIDNYENYKKTFPNTDLTKEDLSALGIGGYFVTGTEGCRVTQETFCFGKSFRFDKVANELDINLDTKSLLTTVAKLSREGNDLQDRETYFEISNGRETLVVHKYQI